MRHLFSSESVTSGHPDKVCDQVSDSLLDAFLTDDPMTRAAIETTACPDFIHVMGEVTTKSKADVEQVVRETVRRIGYTKDEYLFTDKAKLVVSLHAQSPDIAMGVDSTEELGAGDQGMMFGFATNECDNLMPLGLNLARSLTTALTEKRRSGQLPFLRPDGKAQVTLEYDGTKALRCSTIVLSAQHDEDISIGDLRQTLKEEVILKCIPSPLIDEGTRFLINPTGRFVLGGPAADTGLTGRKIIADTYGGYAPHGGGAFSGKDATKVDRSASYVARNIAKTIVDARIADRCLVQLAYAIGISKPVSVHVDCFGTGLIADDKLSAWAAESWDLSPLGMINEFHLRQPQYAVLSETGHFGGLQAWERVAPERREQLKKMVWDEARG